MGERTGGDRVPDLLVEQLALGELGPAEAAAVRARLEAEAGGLARLERILAEDAAIHAAYPAARVMPTVRARAGGRRRSASRWAVPALGVALAAALVFVVARPSGGGAGGQGEARVPDEVRLKGDAAPRLTVYRERAGGGAERLGEGARVAAGDTLQLAYAAAGGARFGVIVSIDGGGAATLHFPRGPGEETRLAEGGEVRLREGYELDDAPGFERFFLVTAERPVGVAEVMGAARRLAGRRDARTAALALPEGLAQTSVTVDKGATP